MLTRLRTWLADVLRPASTVVPTPLLGASAKAPVESTPQPADDGERQQRRLERRRHEAEGRADQAERRVGRAEKARKLAEARVATLESELALARERAKTAEGRLKSAVAAPNKAGAGRGKKDGERARAMEERLRAAEARADRAEGALAEAEARVTAEVARARALTAELAEAKARRDEGRAAEALASSPAKEAPLRRGPRTSLDVFFSPGDECLVAICRQIQEAERTADVCVFTITDDRISNALLDAHRRGVKVRIITDNDKALDEGSDVHRLARAGVEIREDQTPFHMHHKFAVFDDKRMITGSYNWTRGAARNNHENVVVSDDARLIGPFSREFAALWAELAPGGRGGERATE